MLLLYIFIPSVLVLINLLDSFNIDTKKASASETFFVFGVIFIFLWVIGEFLIYLYSKQHTNNPNPSNAKFCFKHTDIPNLNINTGNVDSDKLQIIERINSEQILCCYYENKIPLRIIIKSSELDNIAIYPIKKLSLKERVENFATSDTKKEKTFLNVTLIVSSLLFVTIIGFGIYDIVSLKNLSYFTIICILIYVSFLIFLFNINRYFWKTNYLKIFFLFIISKVRHFMNRNQRDI